MARKERERPALDSSAAALLTWFVPGAAHWLLGRPGQALAAFALIEGLYWWGLQLSGGMGFEFLDFELRSLFAPALAPEIGNLGGFVYQMRAFGYGPGFLRPWPEAIALGGVLTALSGVLNACLMAHAHLLARSAQPEHDRARNRPIAAVVLAWLVPGLGHLYQGRRARAAVVFGALVGLFLLGTWLAEGSNLSRERHFYYWSGQFLLGVPALVAQWIGGGMHISHAIPLVDAGLVFGCVAGLLNLLAMIDVFDFGEARLMGWAPRTLARATADGGARGALDAKGAKGA